VSVNFGASAIDAPLFPALVQQTGDCPIIEQQPLSPLSDESFSS
jgi:hypothetical protein